MQSPTLKVEERRAGSAIRQPGSFLDQRHTDGFACRISGSEHHRPGIEAATLTPLMAAGGLIALGAVLLFVLWQ
jgi:hypothetical protein